MKRICVLMVFMMSFLTALLLSNMTIAMAEDAPLKLSVQTKRIPYVLGKGGKYARQTYDEVRSLIVTSVSDDVSIYEIKLNRGNCGGVYNDEMKGKVKDERHSRFINDPILLNYGQKYSHFISCPELLEVQVSTDKGEWTFNFK